MKANKILGILALVMMMAGPVQAEMISYQCGIPTDGAPVDFYTWQTRADGGEWEDVYPQTDVNRIAIDFEPNVAYEVRVAGVALVVDEEGEYEHQGPWSGASIVYTYVAPGSCGKPWRDK